MSATRLIALTITATIVFAVTPAFTKDGPVECLANANADNFMQIHLDNQKIGSAVSLYWELQTAAWRLAERAD